MAKDLGQAGSVRPAPVDQTSVSTQPGGGSAGPKQSTNEGIKPPVVAGRSGGPR